MGKAVSLPAVMLFSLLCQGCVGKMFYYPDGTVYDTPARHGLRYEEVSFRSKDGTMLSGWYIPAVDTPRGTVIHFHGNAQNMTAHFAFVSWLPTEGFNLFVFDYRGYGRSEGKPDREGLFEDSVAALEYVASRKDVDRSRLLVFGQSLGGANAIAAVGETRFPGIRAVAVESAFSSYRGIVREKLGQMPVLSLFKGPLSHLLVDDDHSPEKVVANIAPVPLLLIHGTADPVVPYSHGERLFALAREPKQLWTMEGSGHTAAFAEPTSPYREKLVRFFNGAIQAGKNP